MNKKKQKNAFKFDSPPNFCHNSDPPNYQQEVVELNHLFYLLSKPFLKYDEARLHEKRKCTRQPDILLANVT